MFDRNLIHGLTDLTVTWLWLDWDLTKYRVQFNSIYNLKSILMFSLAKLFVVVALISDWNLGIDFRLWIEGLDFEMWPLMNLFEHLLFVWPPFWLFRILDFSLYKCLHFFIFLKQKFLKSFFSISKNGVFVKAGREGGTSFWPLKCESGQPLWENLATGNPIVATTLPMSMSLLFVFNFSLFFFYS